MLRQIALPVACAFSFFSVAWVQAEEVTVNNVHLCCGSCVKGVQKALADVAGVSGVKVSRDDETVAFQAADSAAATRGLTALAEAGFYGEPSVPGPDFKVDPQAKKDQIQLSGIHLCCQGCTNSATDALKGVTGVKSVSAQAKQGKMTVTGNDISLAETLKALHAAGFHAKLE